MRDELTLSIEGRLEVVRLEPGDVVAISIEEVLAPMAKEIVRGKLASYFPGHEILILDGGRQVSVIRRSGATPVLPKGENDGDSF